MARTLGGYTLVATAFMTCPTCLWIVLPLLLVLLRGTGIAPLLSENLHLVCIGLVAYCPLAVVGGAYPLRSAPLGRRPVEAWSSRDRQRFYGALALSSGPARTPDRRQLEFQRWLFARGRYADGARPDSDRVRGSLWPCRSPPDRSGRGEGTEPPSAVWEPAAV